MHLSYMILHIYIYLSCRYSMWIYTYVEMVYL